MLLAYIYCTLSECTHTPKAYRYDTHTHNTQTISLPLLYVKLDKNMQNQSAIYEALFVHIM